jgi:hypothetical protein
LVNFFNQWDTGQTDQQFTFSILNLSGLRTNGVLYPKIGYGWQFCIWIELKRIENPFVLNWVTQFRIDVKLARRRATTTDLGEVGSPSVTVCGGGTCVRVLYRCSW